ncbi:MAG: hypothetical protein GC199_01070 [Alphaproteobacteria bacterium]|nr:hypothetical protein [Alphaproteobacteria bacterium]
MIAASLRGAYRQLTELSSFLQSVLALVTLTGLSIGAYTALLDPAPPSKQPDAKIAATNGAINTGGLIPGLVTDASRLLLKAAQNESKRELAELNEDEDPEVALAYYREILANTPNDIEALIAAGDLMRRSGDLVGAKEMFDRLHEVAIQEDRFGAKARAMIGLGDVAVEEKKFTLARIYFDGAIKWSGSAGIFSMEAMALSRLGALELDTAARGYGDYKEAIYTLQRAADAHRKLGDLDRLAEDELLLGRAREASGDLTGAWTDLTHARDRLMELGLEPRVIAAREALYAFAMRHDRIPDAIVEAAALVETMFAAKDPKSGIDALAKLASAYEAAGDTLGACDALGRAIVIIEGDDGPPVGTNDRAEPSATEAAIRASHRRLACDENESARLP